MKLLVLDQYSDPGGGQQQLLDLLPAFAECGWNATVAMPGHGAMFARVRELGFEAARLNWSVLHSAADLVYINGPRCLPFAGLAGVEAPVIFHAHRTLTGWKWKMAGESVRRLKARVIGVCRYVADPWCAYAEHVSVVYNGVAGTAPATLPHDPPVVGCIGRIAPEKGQLEFIDAAAKIHAAMPGCRFVIYGAPLFGSAAAARYEAEVRAAARDLPVEFAGWVDDVYAALAGMDLLLVPSGEDEATTRVILEAFAAGVPAIAFPAGGIPEVIEEGVDGMLAGSAPDMAAKALGLLKDSERLQAMSRAARLTWERRFTLDRFRREVIAVIKG